jgi:ferredoxin-nitrite reductase
MNNTILPEPLASAGFSAEQKEYLTGLFAGIAARGQSFADIAPSPRTSNEDLIFEERVKRELHPLDAYDRIVENAAGNKAPDKEEIFRFKWNGLFYLSPVKDAFMARLRIPGGVVRTYQLRELARIAQELTTGYVQITTRANFQLRLIQPRDTPEFLRRVQSVGLHTRGSGADNIRNITANPTAGFDPIEIIDVLPFVNDLAQIIINERSFYDLPRKFNIAYDGGGLIGSVEDTNDIGVKAVKFGGEVLFRIALGGATGHKAFAQDLGVVVPPAEINKVIVAIIRVFIEHGCRTDRKKARLKHLLEKMSLAEYLAKVETRLGKELRRAPYDPAQIRWANQELPHSHVGDFHKSRMGLIT